MCSEGVGVMGRGASLMCRREGSELYVGRKEGKSGVDV